MLLYFVYVENAYTAYNVCVCYFIEGLYCESWWTESVTVLIVPRKWPCQCLSMLIFWLRIYRRELVWWVKKIQYLFKDLMNK